MNVYVHYSAFSDHVYVYDHDWTLKCLHRWPVKARGDGTVHEVGNPASPAISLTRVELGAVCRVRHQVSLRVPRYTRADFVVNWKLLSLKFDLKNIYIYLQTSPLRQSVCSFLHSALLFLHMKNDQVHCTKIAFVTTSIFSRKRSSYSQEFSLILGKDLVCRHRQSLI